MAANADLLYREIAGYLSRRTGHDIQVIDDIPWQERERLLDRGEAQIGFICGLPYVRKVDRAERWLELLAAPVMRGVRYGGRPIYFSDVVVRYDSPIHSFRDLRGASWSYNEPGSQSGYNVTRYHLARLRESDGFFGRVMEAGAHQTSLRWVIDGIVDASAVDSIVLETELSRFPEMATQVRVIETFGPSTAPPAVISMRVPTHIRRDLRRALLAMSGDADGARALARWQVARFTRVRDADYDDIRRMAREAEPVRLAPGPQHHRGGLTGTRPSRTRGVGQQATANAPAS
jgi:phosphonate transport system substrate-binding protein